MCFPSLILDSRAWTHSNPKDFKQQDKRPHVTAPAALALKYKLQPGEFNQVESVLPGTHQGLKYAGGNKKQNVLLTQRQNKSWEVSCRQSISIASYINLFLAGAQGIPRNQSKSPAGKYIQHVIYTLEKAGSLLVFIWHYQFLNSVSTRSKYDQP